MTPDLTPADRMSVDSERPIKMGDDDHAGSFLPFSNIADDAPEILQELVVEKKAKDMMEELDGAGVPLELEYSDDDSAEI